ncbi:MAG: hypothetical protein ACP5HU_03265 [Phycisphaerae bacterium]
MGDSPVRIDGIQGHQAHRPDDRSALSRPAGIERDTSAGKAVDSSGILAEVRPYIESARKTEEVNAQAVAEAKEMLASGQLQSPDALRRAAEAILSRDF